MDVSDLASFALVLWSQVLDKWIKDTNTYSEKQDKRGTSSLSNISDYIFVSDIALILNLITAHSQYSYHCVAAEVMLIALINLN